MALSSFVRTNHLIQYSRAFFCRLVMSFGYTLIESGGVRSQNAGHSLFKSLLILSKLSFLSKFELLIEFFFSPV